MHAERQNAYFLSFYEQLSIRKLYFLCLAFLLTSCLFGANESGGHIAGDFYLIGWDNRDWQIVQSEDGRDIYNPGKIIIRHDVFAVGHDEDFIIAKQHPCRHGEPHLQHIEGYLPDKNITNYYVIDIRNTKSPTVYKFDNETEFDARRVELGVDKNLTYRFNDE